MGSETGMVLQPKLTQKRVFSIEYQTGQNMAPCYLKRLKADSGQAKLTLKPIQLDSSKECSIVLHNHIH